MGRTIGEWVCWGERVVGSTGKNPKSSPIELYHKPENNKNVKFLQQEYEKSHPMVPPLDHFQGKNENCSSLARTISASRRSFFANLTTFERRSGLKIFSLLKIAILKMG